MLFVSLPNPDDLTSLPDGVDGIEWRLDLSRNLSLERIASYLKKSPLPVMLTLRKESQGGKYRGNEEERETLLRKLLELQPAYFDLEVDNRPEFLKTVQSTFPKTRLVLSWHDFYGVPEDLERLYQHMSATPAHAYKIAVTPKTAAQTLRALELAKTHPDLSVICMGEVGAFGRALGPVAGNVIDYACLNAESKTAPGQLTVEEFTAIYRYHRLNRETSLYGLIGDPVSHSVGHLHHNGMFEKDGVDAVYVKMKVKEEELADFLKAAQKFGFRGISVTMPLKEKVLPFLTAITPDAAAIGAVNTLALDGRFISGSNTDATGALDAIETVVAVDGKVVVILGAGGAAKAIAHEAIARGADVTLLNRTVDKAKALAERLGCRWGGLSDVPAHYAIMINCIPQVMPIDPSLISKTAVMMDITYMPKETLFLKEGMKAGCKIIFGEEMFVRQAAGQRSIWRLTPHRSEMLQESAR